MSFSEPQVDLESRGHLSLEYCSYRTGLFDSSRQTSLERTRHSCRQVRVLFSINQHLSFLTSSSSPSPALLLALMPPLHDRLDATMCHSVSHADFQFSFYLDQRGVGDFVDHSDWDILGETELVGELMLYTCLVEYALGEGISSEHIGMIRSQLFHPKTFTTMLEREPLRFGTDLLETATPAGLVNTFAGALRSVLGHGELKTWFVAALGAAVHAAAEVCVAHFNALEEAELRPTLFPRPTERERNIKRLGAVVQLLRPCKESPACPAPQVPSKRLFPDLSLAKATTFALLSSSGDIAKLWLSNAHQFTMSMARAEYEAFTTSPESQLLVELFTRSKGLLLKSPVSPPPSPPRFRRSRAPFPASPSRHTTFQNAASAYNTGLLPNSPASPPRGFRRSRAPSPASPSRRVDLDNAASPHGLDLASIPKRRKVSYTA
ncbi:hypothetical protein FB45DRAFT_1059386 [Roridomyces roridus]|uniref:Uncharacterized protein n=1 Tax=Roridomyces roridus TaxID=1738132 RepID=A0AAD7FMS7_9AGAR|nr:hypothetical protein FB45DRAFT_1059386 [Roridomyces roridus]